MNVLKTSTFVICVHMTIKILDLLFSNNFWLIQMFLSPTFNFKRKDRLIVTIGECADCTFNFYTPADHSGVCVIPSVITDCAPLPVMVNFNAALSHRFSTNQTDTCKNEITLSTLIQLFFIYFFHVFVAAISR